jgi:hypothetical protein
VGYTHYWSYQPNSTVYAAAWPRIVRDTTRILGELGRIIKLAGPDGTGRPLLEPGEGIAFNGRRPNDYESLDLVAPGPSRRQWFFCKTDRQAYDLAVTATLLRCCLLLPDDFRIDSDGRWDSDWLPARDLVRHLFGDTRDHTPFQDTTAGLAPEAIHGR